MTQFAPPAKPAAGPGTVIAAFISATRILPSAETSTDATTAGRLAAWAPYLRAVAAFLAVRVASVVMLAVMASGRDLPLIDRLTAWDAQWYLRLAEHGYRGMTGTLDAAGQPYADAPMGFFPLFPMAINTVGQFGIPLVAAGLIVSTLAGIAAACGLQRIGRHLGGDRAGLILVALWAGAPMAITQSMVYTEAPFVALAGWSLVGILERRWAMAGLCAMFAGLTRSTAAVLIAVVVIAAVVAAVRRRDDRWPALRWAAVAPLGLLGYWTYVAAQTGSLTGWQDIELRGWGVHFDGGREALDYVGRILTTTTSPFETVVVVVTLGAAALAVLTITSRIPWPLVAYGAGVLALAVTTAGFPFMRARFLLPAFVLLLPIALGLAKRRPATAAAVTAVFVLAGSWFSAYSLTVWRYGI